MDYADRPQQAPQAAPERRDGTLAALALKAPWNGRDTMTFTMTHHACRICTGRILTDGMTFICSICEATATECTDLCGCNITDERGQRLPYRCELNPMPGPCQPSQILIVVEHHTQLR